MTAGYLTAGFLTLLPARLDPSAAPLEPTRQQAREWARDELSDPAYVAAEPSMTERVVGWVLDRLSSLRLRTASLPDSDVGVVLLALLVLVVVAVVLLRAGRLRGPERGAGEGVVFDDVVRTADEYRARADRAAAAGEWAVAVSERFRAVVRSLEERTVLDERPGRTAHEAAEEAADVLPGTAEPLRAGARSFEDVRYGGRSADRALDDGLRDLDRLLVSTRPVWEQPVAAGGRS